MISDWEIAPPVEEPGLPLAVLLSAPGLEDAVLHTTEHAATARPVLDIVGTFGGSETTAGTGALIVHLSELSMRDWHVDALLRRAAASGAVGVVFSASEAPLGTTIALADRLGVALITVQDRWRAVTVATRLVSEPSRLRAELVLQTMRTLREGDVSATLRRLARILGRPCAVVTASGAVLDACGELGVDPAGLPATARFTAVHRSGAVVVGARVDAEDGAEPNVLVAVLPHRSPPEEGAAADALDLAALVVAARSAQGALQERRVAGATGNLLAELQAARGVLTPATARRAQQEGWRLSAWHLGLAVESLGAGDDARIARTAEAAFAASGRAVTLVPGIGMWFGWLDWEVEPKVAAVRAAIDDLRRAVVSSAGYAVGVGRLRAGPHGLVESLDEGRRAVRLAVVEPGGIVEVDGNELNALLANWARLDDLSELQVAVQPMRDARGDLDRTVLAYLDAGGSLVEASEHLGIHRNTVSERLNRVERTFGIRLHDPDVRLGLHIALRLPST